ncbi:MAG: hypothetical protein JW891_02620 [Candidatus Lokiarchaeota archaeon]|nr:hypothetical protein [Candidatus Lokiarchaeota archaeon]
MKNKTKLTGLFLSSILLAIVAFGSIPFAKAASTIPPEYSQDIAIGQEYVYNVTAFGGVAEWWAFSTPISNWSTNKGGQIKVNFTGFYGKDPNDWGDIFPSSNMSWMDVRVYKAGETTANLTRLNCSNSEAQSQMTLGYWNGFISGFLVPNNDYEGLIEMAEIAAEGEDVILSVEETYSLIYFHFKTSGFLPQSTQLIYDKKTGLLVRAWTSAGNYQLDMFLTNYTFDYSDPFIYNVHDFGGESEWWGYDWMVGSRGNYSTNPGGLVIVNVNDFFDKETLDPSPFEGAVPFINITFVENITNSFEIMTFNNVSNSEAAYALAIGYYNFTSGFFLDVNNLTQVAQQAQDQNEGYFAGTVSIQYTNLTIHISFEQSSGFQSTSLIYDKYTGLLQWVQTVVGDYSLEMSILDVYHPENILDSVPSFPILAVIGIIGALSIVFVMRYQKKLNK